MGNTSNAIAGIDHLKAFDDVFKQRFDDIDISSVLMYIIDTAPESALIHLAEQFNVLGFKGWIMATTVAQRRDLIKKAIFLHRHKGTIFSIKEAIRTVGFEDPIDVIEHAGVEYDGINTYNGAINYVGGNWATFRVRIGLPNDVPLELDDISNLINFITEYKNARSKLIDLVFVITFSDVLDPTEFLDLGEGAEDFIAGGIYYNGVNEYAGGNNHDKGAGDTINLTITNISTGQIINDEF